MPNEEIRAIAIKVAQDMGDDEGTDAWIIEYATRFLAAITEKAEPVALDAIYAAWHGAGVDIAGGNWKRFVGMLPPLFTHPAIEPAPQEQKPQTTTVESGSPAQPVPVGAAPLPDDVAELVARLRGYHICTVTNNEAADMIERLANRAKNAINEMEIYRDENENLRRLKDAPATPVARQVPPDCVVVPKEPTEAMLAELFRGYTTRELAYRAMIAAGEVKP